MYKLPIMEIYIQEYRKTNMVQYLKYLKGYELTLPAKSEEQSSLYRPMKKSGLVKKNNFFYCYHNSQNAK
jgi:hypothetical protein